MPYDSLDDVLSVLAAGKSGEPLATGLLIPDAHTAEADDAFGELAQIMLTASLALLDKAPEDRSRRKP